MQPTIQILAERVRGEEGVDKLYALRGLMSYVHSLTDEEFEAEIALVSNYDVFSILWSAGLSAHHQEVALQRARELQL